MNGVARIDIGHRSSGKHLFCRICGKPNRNLHRTNHCGLVCRRCDRREFQDVLDAGRGHELKQRCPGQLLSLSNEASFPQAATKPNDAGSVDPDDHRGCLGSRAA